MGRTITVARYEITPEIKELQKLASNLIPIGYHINIDITQDLVTVNGCHKFTRTEAKEYMENLIIDQKDAMTTADVPDLSIKQPKIKKPRVPGAPPEERTILRRAKRIIKKAAIKGMAQSAAIDKAKGYINRKAASPEQALGVIQLVEKWILTK